MQEYVEKLRQQPRHVRSQVAFLSATVITGLIMVIWVATLPGRLSSTSDKYVTDTDENSTGLFSSIKNTVASAFSAHYATEESEEEEEVVSPKPNNQLDLQAIGAAEIIKKQADEELAETEEGVVLIGTTTPE